MEFYIAALQLLLVVASDLTASQGRLFLYQRESVQDNWQPAAGPFEVALGKNGMAWDRKFRPSTDLSSAFKKEGDGKSPMGIYSLGPVFGQASTQHQQALKMPYLQITADLEGVDDPCSIYYNQIVRSSEIPNPDWKSSEKMQAIGSPYEWGIVIRHNMHPVVKGEGSCVFMHLFDHPHQPTAGCTALNKTDMEYLLSWLDAEKNPILVQLPFEEYMTLLEKWQLPRIVH